MAEAERRIRINITGDGSGLNKEFSRIQRDAKEAFKDIGLDRVLEKADKDFSKIQDRIKAVSQAFKDHKRDSDNEFSERTKKAKDSFSARRVNEDKQDSDKVQEEAWLKWQRLADYLKDALKNKKIDELGNIIKPPGDPDDPEPNKKPTLGQRAFMRAIAGGRLNLAGGAHEAIAGEGGLAESAGAGMVGLAIASSLTIALAAAIGKSFQLGLEQYRTENEVSAKFDIYRPTFGTGENNLGLSTNDFQKFIYDQAKSRTSAQDIENISRVRLALEKARGVDTSDVQRFDSFRQQGSQESGRIIVDILSRAEKGGILGISKSDFTLLPQKIEQVANIVAIQKGNSERVDSNAALNLISAGTRIGGRFGDDRASQAFGTIDSSIKNPGSAGMKAYVFEMLRRANPNASYTDLMGIQEGGASAANLKAILPSIAAMPEGEMRRMVLNQYTHNWQNAIRLDKGSNLQKLISGLHEGSITDTEFKKQVGGIDTVAEGKVDAISQINAHIKTWGAELGHAFVQTVDDVWHGKATLPDIGSQIGYNLALDYAMKSASKSVVTKNVVKKPGGK